MSVFRCVLLSFCLSMSVLIISQCWLGFIAKLSSLKLTSPLPGSILLVVIFIIIINLSKKSKYCQFFNSRSAFNTYKTFNEVCSKTVKLKVDQPAPWFYPVHCCILHNYENNMFELKGPNLSSLMVFKNSTHF
jgi:hypothetical protein